MKNNAMVFQLFILNECLPYNLKLGWVQDLQTINSLEISFWCGSILITERECFPTV